MLDYICGPSAQFVSVRPCKVLTEFDALSADIASKALASHKLAHFCMENLIKTPIVSHLLCAIHGQVTACEMQYIPNSGRKTILQKPVSRLACTTRFDWTHLKNGMVQGCCLLQIKVRVFMLEMRQADLETLLIAISKSLSCWCSTGLPSKSKQHCLFDLASTWDSFLWEGTTNSDVPGGNLFPCCHAGSLPRM